MNFAIISDLRMNSLLGAKSGFVFFFFADMDKETMFLDPKGVHHKTKNPIYRKKEKRSMCMVFLRKKYQPRPKKKEEL